MKFPTILSGSLIALAFLMVALGVFVFREVLTPPPIKFNSVAVDYVTPYDAVIVAEVEREPIPSGCSNGIQADVRRGNEVPTRLPVPLRTQDNQGRSRYALVLPSLSGRYDVQIRETVACSTRIRVISTPWMRMDIPEAVG